VAPPSANTVAPACLRGFGSERGVGEPALVPEILADSRDRWPPDACTLPTPACGEDRVLPSVELWIARRCSTPARRRDRRGARRRVDTDPPMDARVAPTRRRVEAAEAKLRQYRRALDSGADSAVIGAWLNEANEELIAALISHDNVA
jgi:hypothetical protein